MEYDKAVIAYNPVTCSILSGPVHNQLNALKNKC